MSTLKVRKLPFVFGEDVPFQWQPTNPVFATFLNQLSFLAVAFERYIIKVLRDAMPLIKDAEVQLEAKLFFEQEAQHSLAHKLHIDSMIRIYPGLQATFTKACRHFDDLHKRESINFHLAYIANLEATFTPMLSFVINHREDLFSKGNVKISSLFLWHAIEEIEHRRSAYVIYNDIVPNSWYRISKVPSLMRHLSEFFDLMAGEFEANVPLQERTAGLEAPPEALGHISRKEKFLLTLRLIRCFFPWHNPEKESEPEWFKVWMEADRAGADMTCFYGECVKQNVSI